MKKYLFLAICIMISLVLVSCNTNQGGTEMNNATESNSTIEVGFINDVIEADVWILPQTEENLKSTLWGTATISKLKAGGEKSVEIDESDDHKYIIRLIDSDSAYFSVRDVALQSGYTICFKTDGTKYESKIEVIDQSGNELLSEEAFQGAFGAQ